MSRTHRFFSVRGGLMPTGLVSLALAFSLSACGGESSDGGEDPAGNPGGEMMDPGMMDPGMQDPGMMDPGMEDPGMEDPGMEDPGMEMPEPVCQANELVISRSMSSFEETGPRFIGIDDRFNGPFDAILIDLNLSNGPIEPGVYDLAGTSPTDCTVCVSAFRECGDRGCSRPFYAYEGQVEITGTGEPGALLAGVMKDVVFTELNPQFQQATPLEGGEGFCMQEAPFEVQLPARLESVVPDFQLQNCETEEFHSIHDMAAETEGLWMVLSAGWCPACRQFLPQVMDNASRIPSSLISPIVIVGENAAYQAPTLAYCRQYASHYADDASMFYIDHNGTQSFATVFSNIWPYFSPRGEFGLPWNGIIRGEDLTYIYADRSGQPESLGDIINGIIQAGQ